MVTWRPVLLALFVAAMLWTIEPVGARQAPAAPPPYADMVSAAALK